MGRKALSKQQFIKKAQICHNNKYSYEKTEYINMHTNIIVICPDHGEFKVSPSNHVKKLKKQGTQHLKPSGCPVCGKQLVIKRNITGRKTTEQFIEDAIKSHNYKYDYSKVNYTGCRNKVEIICPIHGIFLQVASNHIRGSGCPKCKNSKGQTKVARVLFSMGIKFINEYYYNDCKGDKSYLFFDFYIPSKNMLIEYDGEQHFKPVKFHLNMAEETSKLMFEKTQRYDMIKNQYAHNNNIPLLRIPYTEFNNIEILVREFIDTNHVF